MTRSEFENMLNDHSFNQTMLTVINKMHINPPIEIIESAWDKFFNLRMGLGTIKEHKRV